MEVERFTGGVLDNNCYVIYQKGKEMCYIIDPGFSPKKIIDFIEEMKFKVCGILLTHYHFDHVGAVNRLRNIYECPVYLHTQDVDLCKKQVDIYLNDGDIIDLEGEKIKVIHTPGHTKGGVCFYSEKSKLAFTGDTIFNVDLGRTDLEDGSQNEMEDTIRNIIDKWGNDIMIYPGHGDGCTMKKVRQINKEFLDITQ